MDVQQQRNPDLPPGINQNLPPHYSHVQPQAPSNPLSVASMVLGILALASLCMIYFSPVFAGLSILFALLSKGYEKKMHGYALTGIITSSIALVLEAIIMVAMICFLFLTSEPNQFSSAFWSTYKETGEQLYGDDFDDMLKDAFGEDFDIDQYIEGGTLWLEQ
ncbi:MAG: DUF4190 domain-containing protein [Lachnospiraceae bacterium]|nr:DUF4190 domain-containing protein [Lachnospiraceae bacterium]